jgi:NAD(P)-dependent dehydrogenase (short-subunit alcohol dehydrogenase family)
MKNSSEFCLHGECALVTGGGSGIGLAIARCMASAGARVVIAGRREELLQEAVAELGAGANYVVHDVSQLEHAGELVKKAEAAAGQPLSVLVNNAGIHVKKPVLETTDADFQAILTTHLCAAHALNRAVLPGMLERKHGSIILIGSMASLFGIPQVIAYSTAKTGMLGMVRSLATEVSGDGVRVNAIAPGWIETPMMRKALDGDQVRRDKILSRTPANAFGKPEDIGLAAVYLSSPAARFITGACLPVDGGASIGF